MSDPNLQSGKKRKRSSENSGSELDSQAESSDHHTESRTAKGPIAGSQIPVQPEASATVQEPSQISRIETWISDSHQQVHAGEQHPALFESPVEPKSSRSALSTGVPFTAALLTKQNLKRLRRETMPTTPGTTTNPTTPSNSPQKSTSTTANKSSMGARLLLSINGMHIEGKYALSKYPRIEQEVDRQLVDRDSEKKRDTQELVDTIDAYGMSGELTLQANIMPLLRGQGRSVTEKFPEGEPRTALKAWLEDKLGENWNIQFAGGALPVLEPGTTFEKKTFNKLLAEYPKWKSSEEEAAYWK